MTSPSRTRFYIANSGNRLDDYTKGMDWLMAQGGGTIAAFQRDVMLLCDVKMVGRKKGFNDLMCKGRLNINGTRFKLLAADTRNPYTEKNGAKYDQPLLVLHLNDKFLMQLENLSAPSICVVMDNPTDITKWMNKYQPVLLP